MLWICRAGKDAMHIDMCLNNNKIYLCWENIDNYLSHLYDKNEFYDVVKEKMNPKTKTALSTWGTQLKYFKNDMLISDYVLVPYANSKSYIFAIIEGEYEFSDNAILLHSRNIRIISSKIPKNIFSQVEINQLNAYRTIYKIKNENLILSTITKYLKLN